MVLLGIIVMLAGSSSAVSMLKEEDPTATAGTTAAKSVRDNWNTRSYSFAELSLRMNRDWCFACFSSWLFLLCLVAAAG